MSDNWVVQNLQKSLSTWNDKLAEVWKLLTQSPEDFKGGAIWKVITDIHGADRKELHKVLCRSVSGRRDHTAGLYHLFGICCIATCFRYRCSSGSDGVGICRRADLQYACAGRNCEDGRPYRKGNDGTLSQKGRRDGEK